MVVSFMGTLCVLWLIVRFMVADVRFMVNCALCGYCAFYGLYRDGEREGASLIFISKMVAIVTISREDLLIGPESVISR